MFKEILTLTLLAYLCPQGLSVGPSCGGKELQHSPQHDYWLQTLKHEEKSPFNNNPGAYKVYRNVKDFGAKGDGVTDDSHAINLAISEGDRCGPGTCGSSTISPAIVYFPPGQYLISHSLLQYYFTQFIGDATNPPTLIMAPNFDGDQVHALIASDEYLSGPQEVWTNQNNFYRQIRNFVLDLTKAPAGKAATGIHWQVAQATSITNVVVKMLPNSNHQGIWMENGSGGFMSDLVFEGGKFGMWVGNQQFTSRNITIKNADTGVFMNWNWGWTFKGMKFENCKTAIEMTAGGEGAQGVGSLLLMDSEITGGEVGVKTWNGPNSKPVGAGSLILDNVKLTNVGKAVAKPNGQTVLDGGSKTVDSWGSGRFYDQNGKGEYHQGPLTAPQKPSVLLDGKNFFEKTKPIYTDIAMTDFISVISEGAKGDGKTDDTAAIRSALEKYAGCKVIYFPAGDYVVTDTIVVPPGSRITGEVWSVIMATGAKFGDVNNPRPVFQLGKPGDVGVAEISDMLFSSEGPVPGAIMVQINIKEPANQKGAVGLWDVHFRIGGGKGTQLQSGQCGKGGAAKKECQGAFLMLHIGETGSAYLENMWAWVADHDLDGPTQISIYNGRGVLIESKEGPVWAYGTASEHSVMYQYQVVNAKNVIMGMIQTETPYYQAYPPAPQPFSPVAKWNDPDYSHCAAGIVTCPMAWGLRIVNSENVFIYGAGLYNFFQNYDQGCLTTEHCQDNMVSIEKSPKNIFLYNLNTKASDNMVSIDGKSAVKQADNRATFCSTIGGFIEK